MRGFLFPLLGPPLCVFVLAGQGREVRHVDPAPAGGGAPLRCHQRAAALLRFHGGEILLVKRNPRGSRRGGGLLTGRERRPRGVRLATGAALGMGGGAPIGFLIGGASVAAAPPPPAAKVGFAPHLRRATLT